MSISAQNWAWEQKIDSAAAKLLLLALADQADSRDGAVRYQETTAAFFSQKCNISESTFWRSVKLLEDAGYIRREGGGGRGVACEFWLCFKTENVVNLTTFSKEIPCQIAPETMSNPTENLVTYDKVSAPVHNTNYQSTKERTKRAGARARDDARPARSRPLSQAAPIKWVKEGTEWWAALAVLYAERGEILPKGHPGHGKYVGSTGRYFLASEWQQALDEQAARNAAARGPPNEDATTTSDDDATTMEPGNEDNARQFAGSLRSAEDWAAGGVGRSSSAYG